MTEAEYKALQHRLRELADPNYLAFHQKLVPDVHNLLGVRVPKLRALAKELARGDWRGYLAAARTDSYEETMLQGLVLGAAKMEISELLERLTDFIPKVDNWAVCDCTCAGLKLVARHREQVLAFLEPWLFSRREFEVRFAVVLLMDYYLDASHIDRLLRLYAQVRHEGYYVRMAVAWGLSLCFVRFPERTEPLLEDGTFDPETCRMALQKIVESNRVSPEDKEKIRALRTALRSARM